MVAPIFRYEVKSLEIVLDTLLALSKMFGALSLIADWRSCLAVDAGGRDIRSLNVHLWRLGRTRHLAGGQRSCGWDHFDTRSAVTCHVQELFEYNISSNMWIQ